MERLFHSTDLKLAEKYKKRWLESDRNYLFYLWGLTTHLFLLWGVLDVNFHSPIIKELPVVPAPNGAPAKRVLLFVADGLRFQTFIDKPPPYLRYRQIVVIFKKPKNKKIDLLIFISLY